ncbi:predicted protein [Arabidopsis lyrata subsp. lyrata]|uniref:Predicted protein n=1 Tax=Arabidopsis lyrata subsp. lyrata TaxID=81972 RepID=D7KNZ7_ARALL|nr:predicted protein [Arabidopsis lyrata subsp. lyrata]
MGGPPMGCPCPTPNGPVMDKPTLTWPVMDWTIMDMGFIGLDSNGIGRPNRQKMLGFQFDASPAISKIEHQSFSGDFSGDFFATELDACLHGFIASISATSFDSGVPVEFLDEDKGVKEGEEEV